MSTIVAKPTTKQDVGGNTYPAFCLKDVKSLFTTDPEVDVIKLGETGESAKRSQADKTIGVQITAANKVLAGKDPDVRTPHASTVSVTASPVMSSKKAVSSVRWEWLPKTGDNGTDYLKLSAPDVKACILIAPDHSVAPTDLGSIMFLYGLVCSLSKNGGKSLASIPEYSGGVLVAPGYKWGEYASTNLDKAAATLEIQAKAMAALPAKNLPAPAIMTEVTKIMSLVVEPCGVSNREAMMAAFPEPAAPAAPAAPVTPLESALSTPPATPPAGDNSDLK